MKRNISIILTAVMVLAMAIPAFAAEPAAVAQNPAAPTDRAAVIETLYELEGEPVVIQEVVFDDAAGTWYADAAVWGYGAGIVFGDENGNFNGDSAVTRAELVTILYRYAQYKGADVSIGEDTNILSYEDAFELPAWSIPAFQWACGAGLIDAVDASLLPDAVVTQSEAEAILKNYNDIATLSLWTDDAQAKVALVEYMKAITDESSADYIPPEYRIAVFDLDGTLFCETDPDYFDYTLLLHRVLEDPDYIGKASAFEREVAGKIVEQHETGASFAGLEIDHGKAIASSFAGMTVDEFNAYIQEFKKLPMPSYNGLLRGDGWYLPMLQIVDYLQLNGFTVYVVSGTDRLIVRGIVYNSPLDVPNRQIIGSDEIIVSNNQSGEDGLNYVFTEGDELILGGEFIIKNLKMNKVSVIAQEIGQQPVLSFGNSTGDSSMAEYVTSDNPYKSLAFMLCCDDLERENGNESKANKMFDLCEEFDWVPISMKNDWTTIYGDSVQKKSAEDIAAESAEESAPAKGAVGTLIFTKR